MLPIPADIFTEPASVAPDGLANLGPLRRLAGVWQADKGVDINPKAQGPERRIFREHIRMDPIDPQTNGPQLFYGLRYHIHINTPEEDITFHDQVGYWLPELTHRSVHLLQPELHIHLAVHRGRGCEVLAGLVALARKLQELPEAEVTVGDERAHAPRLGERQRLAVLGLATLGIASIRMGHDVAAQVQRMGREPGVRRRGFERAVA